MSVKQVEQRLAAARADLEQKEHAYREAIHDLVLIERKLDHLQWMVEMAEANLAFIQAEAQWHQMGFWRGDGR